MKYFSRLFRQLDETTSTLDRINALSTFFSEAPAAEASWGCYFLLGGRTSKLLTPRELRELLTAITEIPTWLIEESYHIVGDLAETLTLLVTEPKVTHEYDLPEIATTLLSLKKKPLHDRQSYVRSCWNRLSRQDRFVFNKLITGGFRIGVQKATVVKGLSRASSVPEMVLSERLTGSYEPTTEAFENLMSLAFEERLGDIRPVPFFLAYPLEGGPDALGDPGEWLAEWKWDGIRAQLLTRHSAPLLWSRGEDDISESFPEIVSAASLFPTGYIFDGELLAYKDTPLPFTTLQKRLNRTTPSKNLQQKYPVAFIIYDLLRDPDGDLRSLPLAERRGRLAAMLATIQSDTFLMSQPVRFSSWEQLATQREESRVRNVEGLMLKRLSSEYGQGRRRGAWWKWKIDPLTADMVMIYAQRGHGRRAGLYTDFTFGVWHEGALVPVAKAYSGLTDKEFETINRFIRNNSTEKFGPVRMVEPKIVIEIAFEGINQSSRHKSGIALRFPRMKRIRHDKLPQDADTLASLTRLIAVDSVEVSPR